MPVREPNSAFLGVFGGGGTPKQRRPAPPRVPRTPRTLATPRRTPNRNRQFAELVEREAERLGVPKVPNTPRTPRTQTRPTDDGLRPGDLTRLRELARLGNPTARARLRGLGGTITVPEIDTGTPRTPTRTVKLPTRETPKRVASPRVTSTLDPKAPANTGTGYFRDTGYTPPHIARLSSREDFQREFFRFMENSYGLGINEALGRYRTNDQNLRTIIGSGGDRGAGLLPLNEVLGMIRGQAADRSLQILQAAQSDQARRGLSSGAVTLGTNAYGEAGDLALRNEGEALTTGLLNQQGLRNQAVMAALGMQQAAGRDFLGLSRDVVSNLGRGVDAREQTPWWINLVMQGIPGILDSLPRPGGGGGGEGGGGPLPIPIPIPGIPQPGRGTPKPAPDDGGGGTPRVDSEIEYETEPDPDADTGGTKPPRNWPRTMIRPPVFGNPIPPNWRRPPRYNPPRPVPHRPIPPGPDPDPTLRPDVTSEVKYPTVGGGGGGGSPNNGGGVRPPDVYSGANPFDLIGGGGRVWDPYRQEWVTSTIDYDTDDYMGAG